MFFISPPPSPPFGWEVREEAAPNKEVHAKDLASALAALRERREAIDDKMQLERRTCERGNPRGSTTTTVYEPDRHGGSSGLPAVIVEDTTGSDDANSIDGGKIPAHTARPPVELMHDQ